MEYKKGLHPIEKNVQINLKIMKKIALILSIIFLSASRFADVQEIKISGTVTSREDGLPIPGVNIVEKGTSSGVITDLGGRYEINVKSESSVLVFSSVGFITEKITVKSKRVIDVKLFSEIQPKPLEVEND